ncbi:MAG: molybdopterin molybdotransferase MoeA [Pseudomonadota bacterium]
MSGLISVDDALALIERHRPRLETETVALASACGRTLAAPIIARRTHPPQSMSAMDGYAVRLADVRAAKSSLHVVGEAPAGRPFEGRLNAGEAVRIFTGGVVPEGADHIIIQENTARDGDKVTSFNGYDQPAHIRRAGIDFRENDVLTSEGVILRPEHLSIAAAANTATVEVSRPIRVGLFSNGDELKPPGSQLAPGEIVNSNPYGLKSLIESWGGEALDLGIARDDPAAIQALIERAAGTVDVLVPIGGASVGDHDHMRAAFAATGFTPVFEKIAVRPGKPTWFSKTGSTLALGLPGNPASAFVCAHLFLAPLLGQPWTQALIKGKLVSPIAANGTREHFMRARAEINDQGQIMIDPAPSQDSSLLRPFLSSNILLRRSPKAEVAHVGAIVEGVQIGPIPS